MAIPLIGAYPVRDFISIEKANLGKSNRPRNTAVLVEIVVSDGKAEMLIRADPSGGCCPGRVQLWVIDGMPKPARHVSFDCLDGLLMGTSEIDACL